MITLLTGTTGSGKTYRAVFDMLEALTKGRKIYSNIELSIESADYIYIDEIALRDFFNEIQTAFNGTNLEKAKENYRKTKYANALIVLDEVQFLGMKTYTKSVSDWLTLHRHFGQDVVLITQVIKNISPVYQDLCHKHIEYRSASNRLISSYFQYTEYDAVKGEKIKTRMSKPDSRVFEVYKTGKSEGSTHPLMYKFLAIVAGLIVMVYLLTFSDRSVINLVTNKKETNSTNKVPESQLMEIIENNTTIETTSNYYNNLICSVYQYKPSNYIYLEPLQHGYYACTLKKNNQNKI